MGGFGGNMFGFFTRSGDFSREDQNTGIKQFQKSGSDPLSLIFIRELIQNLIDAAISGKVPLLKFKIVKMKSKDDKDFIDDLFKETNALHKVNKTETLGDVHTSLVMEEFNTTGLTGTYDIEPSSLAGNHWSNFWFGQMRESKTGSKGGRRGVGKIALNMISGVRAVIAKTIREDGDIAVGGRVEFEKRPRIEDKQEIFDNFAMLTSSDLDKDKIYDDLRENGREALQRLWDPIKEENHIKQVSDVFNFTRKNDEVGTSWAIPAPLAMFDKDKETKPLTNLDNIEKYILKEFIWAIAKGSLRLDFGNGEINDENIEDRFKSLFPDDTKYFDFIDEVRTFNKKEALFISSSWEGDELDSLIEDGKKNNAVQNFDDGEMISFKFVASVKKKSQPSKTTNYYVHLKRGDDSLTAHREEFYRNWLKISNEKKIKGKSSFVYAFVDVEDNDLCEFLAACEVSDHNSFADSLGYSANYEKVRDVLGKIRRSPLRAYELLNRLNPNEVEDLFADILGLPEPASKKSETLRGRKEREPRPEPPRPRPKTRDLFDLYIRPDQVIIEPGNDSFLDEEMPKRIKVRVTSRYMLENEKYFDLADDGFLNAKVINNKNVKVIFQERDILEIEVLDPDFLFELDSFDSKIAFKAKVELD